MSRSCILAVDNSVENSTGNQPFLDGESAEKVCSKKHQEAPASLLRALGTLRDLPLYGERAFRTRLRMMLLARIDRDGLPLQVQKA